MTIYGNGLDQKEQLVERLTPRALAKKDGGGFQYLRVCTDGPVFNPSIFDGLWDEMPVP